MPPNINPRRSEDAPLTPRSQQDDASTQYDAVQPVVSESQTQAMSATPSITPFVEPSTGGNDEVAYAGIDEQFDQASIEPYYSTLVTEPLHQSAVQTDASQSRVPLSVTSVEVPKKKRTGLLIFVLLCGIGIAIAAYMYLGAGRVAKSDLKIEIVQNTRFLRPQQWQDLGIATSSYGDKLAKGGKSTALVSVTVSPTASPTLVSASDETYKYLRTTTLNMLTEDAIAAAFSNSGHPCTSKVSLQKSEDTTSDPRIVGLYRATAVCERGADEQAYVLKLRSVAGRDGHLRTIAILAVQSNWDRNEDAYQAMLDSLWQHKDV